MKNILFVASLTLSGLLSLLACDRLGLCTHEAFTFDMRDHDPLQLRIDGYYYRGDGPVGADTTFGLWLLFQNGVSFAAPHFSILDSTTGEVDIDILDIDRKYRNNWGIFRIEDDKIEIQYWLLGLRGCAKLLIYKGGVLNDSTFVLNTYTDREDQVLIEFNHIYHFRPFYPKPDSTNDFVP